jgi:transposase-like protein
VVLQAGKSERTARRLGYWSGYYSQALVTRVGKIALRVPQDRQGRFRTDLLERYQSSEKALCGGHDGDVFTRGLQSNVKIITEELWGARVQFVTISRIVQQLDEDLDKFARRRPEEPYPYLILDARCI